MVLQSQVKFLRVYNDDHDEWSMTQQKPSSATCKYLPTRLRTYSIQYSIQYHKQHNSSYKQLFKFKHNKRGMLVKSSWRSFNSLALTWLVLGQFKETHSCLLIGSKSYPRYVQRSVLVRLWGHHQAFLTLQVDPPDLTDSYYVFLFVSLTNTPGGPKGPGGPGGPGGGPLRSLSHVGEIEPLSEWGPPLRSISPWPPGGSTAQRDTVEERTGGKIQYKGKEGWKKRYWRCWWAWEKDRERKGKREGKKQIQSAADKISDN